MGSRNSTPPSAAYTTKVTPLAALNCAEENRLSGSTGIRARRSRSTKAPSKTTPATSAPTGAGLVQPADGPSIRP